MVEPGPTRSPWPEPASNLQATAGLAAQVDPISPPETISPADQRRLQDGAWQRWFWAVGSNAPLVGLPIQLLHAISRHTITPMVWSSLLALPPLVAQMLLVLDTGLDLMPFVGDPVLLRQQVLKAAAAHLASFGWLSLVSLVLGILGHRLGQDRVLAATRRRLGRGVFVRDASTSDPALAAPGRTRGR